MPFAAGAARLKRLHMTKHAQVRADARGTTEAEVVHAVEHGQRSPAKAGRQQYQCDFAYGSEWNGKWYATKRVVPVVVEEQGVFVVVTVHTYYF